LPIRGSMLATYKGMCVCGKPQSDCTWDESLLSNSFSAALRLFDTGQPPTAPQASRPPPSSQLIRREEPPSSAPSRVSASQPTEPPSSMPPSSQSTQYRFDFGKHAGKTLDEIPAQYIEFLKREGIVESRPNLAVAVIRHEREQAQRRRVGSSQSAPGTYTLTFGKHIGKTLRDVPSQYISWLRTSCDVYQESKALRDAVADYDRYTNPPVVAKKSSNKRKRASQTSSSRHPKPPNERSARRVRMCDFDWLEGAKTMYQRSFR
jgi:uncharacterized protein (DUF3820 family)